MTDTAGANGWTGVARETFERSIVPWVGRKYEGWLRAWARPHPVDPGQMLVPERVYRVSRSRGAVQPLSRWQLDAVGYPELRAADQDHRPTPPAASQTGAQTRAQTWAAATNGARPASAPAAV